MEWFTLVFTLVMLAAPLGFALPVRVNESAGGDARAAGRHMFRLYLATTASLAVFGGLYALIGQRAYLCWPLFFLLFFVFAMPAIVAKNPDWGNVHAAIPGRARTASISSRARRSPLHAWHWAACWLIVAAAVGTVAVRPFFDPPLDDAGRVRFIVAVVILLSVEMPMPAILAWGVRMVLREPEPMDAEGSPELARAYERHRNFKIWSFYAMFGITMTALLGAGMAALVWLPPHARTATIGGWIGGGAGAAIGIAGAVFGIAASVHRVRITGLLRELEQRHGQGT